MEGYGLMNSGSFSLADGHADESFQRQWQQQLDAWRRLLAQCGKKPSRKRVHGLRVGTLRIQALLEFWQGTHGCDPAADAVKGWSRQAKKLRKALQPVRSAEVYLGQLAGLGKKLDGAGTGPDCAREISALERRFVRRRKAAVKEVIEAIGDRGARLERWGKEIGDAVREPVAEDAGAAGVREQIAGLRDEFPALTADCLHAFRKRVKNLRYLAEFVAERDAHVAQWAKELAKMQGVIGEWRDWQLLAEEARGILKKKSVLPDRLAELEAKALRRALRLCRRWQMRLGEHDLAERDGAEEAQRKKIVRAVPIENGLSERQRA
jgi:CHAD domain-containing protein